MKTWIAQTIGCERRRCCCSSRPACCWQRRPSTRRASTFAAVPPCLACSRSIPPISATFPPGTTRHRQRHMTIPLPPDGILKFSRFRSAESAAFVRPNAANTPVTILVAGDVTITGSSCCFAFSVAGTTAAAATPRSRAWAGSAGRAASEAATGRRRASTAPPSAAPVSARAEAPGNGDAVHRRRRRHVSRTAGIAAACRRIWRRRRSVHQRHQHELLGRRRRRWRWRAAHRRQRHADHHELSVVRRGRNCAGPGNGSCCIIRRRRFRRRHSAGGANSLEQDWSGLLLAAEAATRGTDGRIRLESIDTSAQTQFDTTHRGAADCRPDPARQPDQPDGGDHLGRRIRGPGGATGDIRRHRRRPAGAGPDAGGGGDDRRSRRNDGGGHGQAADRWTGRGADRAPDNCSAAGACDALTTFNLAAGAYVVEARATFQLQ